MTALGTAEVCGVGGSGRPAGAFARIDGEQERGLASGCGCECSGF